MSPITASLKMLYSRKPYHRHFFTLSIVTSAHVIPLCHRCDTFGKSPMMLQSLMVITEPLILDRHDGPGEAMMRSTAPSKPAPHIYWQVSQSGTVGDNRTAGHSTEHRTCKSGPAHHALRIACTLDLDLSTFCVCMHLLAH